MISEKYLMLAELAVSAIDGQDVHQELNFAALLEPKLRKIFYETYDEVEEQYSKVYHVLNSKKAKETDYGLGAMGAWAEFGSSTAAVTGTNDMPEVPYATIPAGLERTYTHKEFAKGFIVERKFIDDEQYNVINKMPADLARAGRYKVETDAATLFNNAFSKDVGGTGLSAIYDGVALIDDAHPLLATGVAAPGLKSDGTALATGKTSNKVIGALSDTTLKAALLKMRQQCDEAGKLIQMKADTLVVPPQLEFLALELIKSSQKVGTSDNDINTLQGSLKVVVLDFLTDADAWFVMDSKRHQLNFFWRVRPEFKREEDFNTLVTKYRGYMRYSYGCSDFRGVVGSAGA